MTLVATFPLLTRNFNTIVADQTATLAASLSANSDIFDTLNLTPGSPMLALIEANGGIALFMQFLAYKVLRSTRLATAEGDDLDSFGADFLFARYPATPATGQVLFTRATAGGTTTIPINTLLKTSNGSQSFFVIPPAIDPFNQFDPINGYIMLPGVFTISVLVQAVTPGTGANISANTLTKLQSSSIAMQSVNNPASFINGADAANDDAYRSAFALYIKSRDNGTLSAYKNAIATTSTSYSYAILENHIAIDAPLPGAVAIYFDDGSGFPSQLRQVELQNNIDAIRAACITPFVIAANPISLIIQMQSTFATSAARLASVQIMHDSIANYINSLGVGENLIISRLNQVLYNATPLLQEVYDIVITAVDQKGANLQNNGLGDVVVGSDQVLRFIPNPPLVNGQAAIQPSIIVIN